MKINGYFILNGEVQSLHITDLKRGLNYVKFERARPHGEWLTEPHSRIIHCSNCGAKENMLKIHIAKWCYSCGADMRDKKDDLATIIEAAQSMKNKKIVRGDEV